MNDGNDKPEFAKRKSPLEQLGENIRVLSDRFDIIEKLPATVRERFAEVNKAISIFRYDLNDPQRRHGYTSTRTIALEALAKAKLETRFDKLGEHKVIKNLSEELDKYVGQANMKFSHLRREIEAVPSPDNMHDLLKESFTFKELNKTIEVLASDQSVLDREGREYQEQINAIQETYEKADHPTREEFEDLMMGHEIVKMKHNDLVHFLKGAFANLGFYPVAKCIEEYKIRTKTESKDNEEPTATSEQTE